MSIARRGATSSAGAAGARADTSQIEAQDRETTRAGLFIGMSPLGENTAPTVLNVYDQFFMLSGPQAEGGPIATMAIDRYTGAVIDSEAIRERRHR